MVKKVYVLSAGYRKIKESVELLCHKICIYGGSMNQFISKGIVVSSFILLGLVFSVFLAPVNAQANPSELLKEGIKGDAVMKLQMMLRENGFYDDAIDGHFGASTKKAVYSFQLAYDLLPDGIAGPETLLTLREANPQVSRGKMAINRSGREIALFAQKFINTPYAWGGIQPGGFDCSGYIFYIFKQYGIELPRMADEQFEVGASVPKSQLQEGDLVYFSTYEPGPSHVGIYIGANKFIHASSAAEKVTITPLDKPYYVERYLGARRINR